MKKLTAKQSLFVNEYLIDLNATQAAIRAGYSKKTACAVGTETLRKPYIQSEIQKAMAERRDRVVVKADAVLRRLVEEFDADIADLYYENGDIKPINEWPKIWRTGLVQGIDTEKIGTGKKFISVKKIKVSDRLRRTELLGKHLKLFTDRHEITVEHKEHNDMMQDAMGRLTHQEAIRLVRLVEIDGMTEKAALDLIYAEMDQGSPD